MTARNCLSLYAESGAAITVDLGALKQHVKRAIDAVGEDREHAHGPYVPLYIPSASGLHIQGIFYYTILQFILSLNMCHFFLVASSHVAR
jgi:hypothetical protein